MASGMTRSEQGTLIGVVLLIIAGVGLRAFLSEDKGEGVWIETDSRWQPIEFDSSALEKPIGDSVSSPASVSSSSGGRASAADASLAAIDINHAGIEELDRLPGIGPAKARAILDYRARVGAFRDVGELIEVSGIGEKTLEKILPYVVAGSKGASSPASPRAADPRDTESMSADSRPWPSPIAEQKVQPPPIIEAPPSGRPQTININRADAEALQIIPGIGPVLARRIIEYRRTRPFKRPDDLIEISGIGPKTLEKMRPWVSVR